MASINQSYEGSEIEIEDDTNLTIDGKHIECEHDSLSGKWSSKYLPYTHYDSLLDLARAIARDAAEFSDAGE